MSTVIKVPSTTDVTQKEKDKNEKPSIGKNENSIIILSIKAGATPGQSWVWPPNKKVLRKKI